MNPATLQEESMAKLVQNTLALGRNCPVHAQVVADDQQQVDIQAKIRQSGQRWIRVHKERPDVVCLLELQVEATDVDSTKIVVDQGFSLVRVVEGVVVWAPWCVRIFKRMTKLKRNKEALFADT